MAGRPLQSVIHQLRRAVSGDPTADVADAQLLEAFVRRRDEAAFELLVWRHAAMVLSVCRRLLHDRHEAEDAFQATFLVLVRKAASISKREALGAWLHRVATRIAHRARSRTARHPHQALPDLDLPAPQAPDEVLWRDLRPVLEEEVNRLPEKYRRPFVLCYLEGNTNEQAARQLGCPRGTILSRLVRGRERLRSRLARRGVVLSGGLLAALLLSRAAAAAVPPTLVNLTVKAAIPFAAGAAAAGLVSARTAAWTEGVLHAMFMTRIKMTAALVLAALLTAGGAGLLGRSLLSEVQAAQGEREKRPEARPGAPDGRGTPRGEVRGVVKAVDAGKGTITITLPLTRREEGEQEKTFTLAKDADVGIASTSSRRGAVREGKLTDLAPGALVVLSLSEDQKAVESILADGPAVRGTVKSVDAGKHTITISIMTHSGRREEAPATEDKTFTISPKAEIGTDDGRARMFSIKETKLADLPVGAVATLKLSVNLEQVQVIVAEGSTVTGSVKAVDAGKRQITLTTRPGRGDEVGEEKTFEVAADADIQFDDGKGRRFSSRDGKLADLPVGAAVTLKLSADQKAATIVQAGGPPLQGWFKSADPAKNTITLVTRRARDGTAEEEKTFNVAKDARVVIDGKEARLADLKADGDGPQVGLRMSLDQQMVHGIIIGTSSVRR